ncbi:hypothetical protein MGSAQ_002279 [marine sediment metagenome]|uniref:Uncharacterized protein n=1 Tax=marine sediment metagenome TaxID=412755 RepID=A0A1B6NRW5_9ZZZZ
MNGSPINHCVFGINQCAHFLWVILRNKKAEQNKVSDDYCLNHFPGYISFLGL